MELHCAGGGTGGVVRDASPAMVVGMEALVILIVPLVALVIYLVSRTQTYGVPRNTEEQLTALRQQEAWHEHRLQHARAKNWDREMIHRISEELDDTRFQLAQVNASAQAASRQNPAS